MRGDAGRATGAGAECHGARPARTRGGPVTEAYTVFWTMDRWLGALSVGHKPFPVLFGGPHLSEPSFRRAGVKVGDLLYPVAVMNRQVYLVARMRVREMMLLGQEDGTTLIDQRFPQFSPGRCSRRPVPRKSWSAATGRPCALTSRCRRTCSSTVVPLTARGTAAQARQGWGARPVGWPAWDLPTCCQFRDRPRHADRVAAKCASPNSTPCQGRTVERDRSGRRPVLTRES